MTIHRSDIRNHESEVLLVAAVRAVCRQHGGLSRRVATAEVPMGRRRADVVLTRSDGELISIELKMNDWARALSQAILNQLWVDRSYIAIPNKPSAKRAAAEAQRHGIGVIGVDGKNAVVLCQAEPSTILDSSRKSQLSGLLSL